MSRLADWTVYGLTLLWGLLLLIGVLLVQRDLFLPALEALARLAWQVGVAGWIVAAGAGVGWAIVRALKLPGHDGERWLVAVGLGLGAVGWLWLVMGLVRLPTAPLAAGLLALPLLALGRWRGSRPPWPRLPRPLLALALVLGTLSFTQALAPPTAFDALLYHLRLPELWLQGGTLFQPQTVAAFFHPVLIEALYTPALQLGGAGAATLLHWVYLPLTLALLWQLTRRFLPGTSAPLALTLALTLQAFPLLAGWAYTDLPLAFYQVAAVWALLHWQAEGTDRGWLVVAAGCAGLAMGVKYLAVLTPLMALAFIALVRRRAALRALVGFSVVAGLVALPSLLRNTIATGNPFFPFGLPSPYWDDFRAAWWYGDRRSGLRASPADLLALPWHVTLGTRDQEFFDGRIGPLFAAFTPLALWFGGRGAGTPQERRALAVLAAFAAGNLLFWLLGILDSAALWRGRFLLPPLLLLCPVVAWGIGQLDRLALPHFEPAAFVRLFVGVWAVFATLIAVAEWAEAAPLAALLAPDPHAWQVTQLGSYGQLVDQTRQLPDGASLLLFFEPRSYGMPLRTRPDTILVEFPWRLDRAAGAADRLQGDLCAEGFTHVGLYWRGARFLHEEAGPNRLTDEQLATLDRWRRAQTLLWESDDGYHQLLELTCR